MQDCTRHFINGEWRSSTGGSGSTVINPATGKPCGYVALGSIEDAQDAVTAARVAFADWSATPREERILRMQALLAEYDSRSEAIAEALTDEIGCPLSLSRSAQVPIGRAHIATAIEVLHDFRFEDDRTPTRIVREPVGVCGLITPWNWPLNQIACKVAPALAAGCTVVLKPSELSPASARIFAEAVAAAGFPKGVFNLVQGDGTAVGAELSRHPDVDMVSFTGSNRAGVRVAINAAPTVKRVHQELGGKSACIVLDDDALADNVASAVLHVMLNSGQSCNAPTRILAPASRRDEAVAAARKACESLTLGNPRDDVRMGPVVSDAQWKRVQAYIELAIAQGATLVCGGLGKPPGLESGAYVRPTVFADVTPDSTLAREEVFGPVAALMTYESHDEAVRIANETIFGLAGYVRGADVAVTRSLATRIRAGQVSINGAGGDFRAPFGGYRQSGNGREWGEAAFHEFLEVKALLGFSTAEAP